MTISIKTQYSVAQHDQANPRATQSVSCAGLPKALRPCYQRLLIHLQWVQRFRGPVTRWRTSQYAQQLTTLLTDSQPAQQQAHLLQVATQSWYEWMQLPYPAGSVLVNECVLLAAALCRQLRQPQFQSMSPTQVAAPAVDQRCPINDAGVRDAAHLTDSTKAHDPVTSSASTHLPPVVNTPGGK